MNSEPKKGAIRLIIGWKLSRMQVAQGSLARSNHIKGKSQERCLLFMLPPKHPAHAKGDGPGIVGIPADIIGEGSAYFPFVACFPAHIENKTV